jgi:hypothetical protein
MLAVAGCAREQSLRVRSQTGLGLRAGGGIECRSAAPRSLVAVR